MANFIPESASTKSALSIPAACDLIDCKRTKMYALIGAGELEPCKVGNRTKITLRSLQAYLERGVAKAKQTWPR